MYSFRSSLFNFDCFFRGLTLCTRASVCLLWIKRAIVVAVFQFLFAFHTFIYKYSRGSARKQQHCIYTESHKHRSKQPVNDSSFSALFFSSHRLLPLRLFILLSLARVYLLFSLICVCVLFFLSLALNFHSYTHTHLHYVWCIVDNVVGIIHPKYNNNI